MSQFDYIALVLPNGIRIEGNVCDMTIDSDTRTLEIEVPACVVMQSLSEFFARAGTRLFYIRKNRR